MRLVNYVITQSGEDEYEVEVVPLLKTFASGGTVTMTGTQFEAFKTWTQGYGYIQDIRGLTASQREMLLSGMTDDDFEVATMSGQEEED